MRWWLCKLYSLQKKRMNEPHTGKSVLRKKGKEKETDWRKRGVTLGWEMDSEEDEAGSQFFPLPERIHIPLVFFYFLLLISSEYTYLWVPMMMKAMMMISVHELLIPSSHVLFCLHHLLCFSFTWVLFLHKRLVFLLFLLRYRFRRL